MDQNEKPEEVRWNSDPQGSDSRPDGPRTGLRKKQNTYNPLKHGIFAKVVLNGGSFEEAKEYKSIVARLITARQPKDDMDIISVEQLAFAYLRMARVYKADIQLYNLILKRTLETLENRPSGGLEALASLESESTRIRNLSSPDPELLLRYETQIDKQIDRILNRLERRELLRRGRVNLRPEKL